MWRSTLGKGTAIHSATHRRCGRTWRDFCVFALYGDAAQEDLPWLCDALSTAEAQAAPAQLCVGDYNWRSGYGLCFAGGWASAPVLRTTVDSPCAAPTRCLSRGAPCEAITVEPLAGVPHHCAVVYEARLQASRRPQERRARRCAEYQWHAKPTQAEKTLLQQAAAKAAPQPAEQQDLQGAWAAWHTRAEEVLKHAVRLDLAVRVTAAERPKGSRPTTRTTAEGALHRPPESIAVRRLRRLHRAAAEQFRRRGGLAPLTEPQRRHWTEAHRCGIICSFPCSQAEALQRASSALTEAQHRQQTADAKDWRRRFSAWAPSLVKSAAPALRACSTTAAAFTATDMREEWSQWWCPEDFGPMTEASQAQSWQELAEEGGVPSLAERQWQPPSEEAFAGVLRNAKGAAGLDGWTPGEIRALIDHAPWLIAELHGLFVRTTEAASEGLPSSVQRAVYSWRIVGIPKRGTDDSRPIAIASCLVRAWHRALMTQLPDVPPKAVVRQSGLRRH